MHIFSPPSQEEHMNDVRARAIAAHGGLERWNTFNKLTATVLAGGGLRPMKGIADDHHPWERTVTLREQTTCISPFGQPDWRMAFTPDRVVIETSTGALVSERSDPRAAFAGHVLETVWDLLHRAYFNGYTIWTYLTTPFLMAMPGFEVAEISPWHEGGERWRGLRARFPDKIASHSQEQDFYFGDDFLLRRHDYHLDVAGPASRGPDCCGILKGGGFRFSTQRRGELRRPGLEPSPPPLPSSLRLSKFPGTTQLPTRRPKYD